MGPVYINEYEARAEYYDDWLQKQLGDGNIPVSLEERHKLLLEKRMQAYQKLCDIVYEEKGFTSQAIPKRATVSRFGLMDEQASQLLEQFGV
jgi:aldehyde:ferredoxin oxidoreductase